MNVLLVFLMMEVAINECTVGVSNDGGAINECTVGVSNDEGGDK